MKTKEELIKLCRFYKGENNVPFDSHETNKALMWLFEQKWVEYNLSDVDTLSEMVNIYKQVGLHLFNIFDDTPYSLRALLFSGYCNGNTDSPCELVESFKLWYYEYYLEE